MVDVGVEASVECEVNVGPGWTWSPDMFALGNLVTSKSFTQQKRQVSGRQWQHDRDTSTSHKSYMRPTRALYEITRTDEIIYTLHAIKLKSKPFQSHTRGQTINLNENVFMYSQICNTALPFYSRQLEVEDCQTFPNRQ